MHTKKLERQPVILVTNDDGVSAKGLQCLIEMVKLSLIHI